MENIPAGCDGKSDADKSSGLTGRDRFAPARHSQDYRDRKKLGHAVLKVECDERAAHAAARSLGMPIEQSAALLVELAAMKAIDPDPERTHYFVQRDGSCWAVVPGGELDHFSVAEWANWKSSGFIGPCVGWRHPLGFTERKCPVLNARDLAVRRRLLGFPAASVVK